MSTDPNVVMCPVSSELVDLLRGEGQVYERVRIWIDDHDTINVQDLSDRRSA